MIVKLLTENHLEFISLKGGCRGSSESTLVKKSNCWKSHAVTLMILSLLTILTLTSCVFPCLSCFLAVHTHTRPRIELK